MSALSGSDRTGGNRREGPGDRRGTEGYKTPITRAMNLRPFQRTFIRRAMDPEILTAALCLSRGNGKSPGYPGISHPGYLDPESPYFRPGTESVLMAASLEQGRIVFRFAREILDDDPAYKSRRQLCPLSDHAHRNPDIDTADLQQRERSDGSRPLSLCVWLMSRGVMGD